MRKKPRKLKKSTYSLIPGEYQIVGRKKGHKDVKLNPKIEEGVQHPPVTVICHEKRGSV